MNHKDKINEIIEVSKKRLELKKIGLLPYAIGPTGPTGPSGRGLEIMGSYASLEELKKITLLVKMAIVILSMVNYIFGILLFITGLILVILRGLKEILEILRLLLFKKLLQEKLVQKHR